MNDEPPDKPAFHSILHSTCFSWCLCKKIFVHFTTDVWSLCDCFVYIGWCC